MLLVGSDDGLYRVTDVFDPGETETSKVLDSDQVMRIETFAGIDGVFAATTSGLYYTADGDAWRDLGVPTEQVYAVGASPGGERIYAGTRPAHVYVAETASGAIADERPAWRDLEGVRTLAARDEWGIDRHENTAQVRDVRVPSGAPDRVVVGVEVGGVYVGDDRGETWIDRSIEGFDAPHTDDIHHVRLEDDETVVAATGSGLYRSTDTGRAWRRLDEGHRQTYFRESGTHDGTLLAGGSPTPPSSWEEDRDHALFESRDGRTLTAVSSPTPDEVVVAWSGRDGDVLGATNRGTLVHRGPDGWRTLGSVPAAESVHGRCIPLCWDGP